MDKIDLKVLQELTENSETSFRRIAMKLGLSPKTVQNRYEKMERQGVIFRSTVELDLSKIGYSGKSYFFVRNSPKHEVAETVNAISKLKQIFLVAEIVGDFDVIALAMIRDFDDAVNINNCIRKIPSVSQVEIAFTSNTTFPLTDKFGSIFQYEELWKNFSTK
jgi:DNA-binding Lrp family transcriptional regulator